MSNAIRSSRYIHNCLLASQLIRCEAPTPHEIVTDYSNALIGAVIRSFVNGMTKNLYCNASLHKLLNDQAPLPSVFIRLDISQK